MGRLQELGSLQNKDETGIYDSLKCRLMSNTILILDLLVSGPNILVGVQNQ